MTMDAATALDWAAWRVAARGARLDGALRGLYARLDAEIAERGPTCWQSGKCCDFDGYGHRLYVTGLEAAWFWEQVSDETAELPDAGELSVDGLAEGAGDSVALPQWGQSATRSAPGVCPYQVDKRCTAHAVRPLGCRIFFCQRGTEAWQQELYEGYLQELRRLHEAEGLAYRYADWLVLLEEVAAVAEGG